MLKLTHIINKGTKRLCLKHPNDAHRCVKIAMYYRNVHLVESELLAYKAAKPYVEKYIPKYEPELVKTNLGLGVVCELIHEDDGSSSPRLHDCAQAGLLTPDIVEQIHDFCNICIKHPLPFYDMNFHNFLIQTKNGNRTIKYIDLKSYNKYKPWTYLHLEQYIPALSRYILKRRIKRFLANVERYANKAR